MTRTLTALCLALLLTGCSTFTLGSFNYCAKDSACASEVRPFRGVEAVPVAASGAAGAAEVPVVKAP